MVGLESFWKLSGSAEGIAGTDEVMLLGGSKPLFVPVGTFSILGKKFDDTIPLGGVDELGVWRTCKLSAGCGWAATGVSFRCCGT